MTLMSNPRVPYELAHERKKLVPMAGKPLMIHVAINVEYWPFDQPMPRTVMPAPHGQSPVPDVGNFAWVEYGMRVGMSRLLRVLGDRGIKASALMNAVCADVYPACVDAMLNASWEFVGHCWFQRSLLREPDETEVIVKSLDRLKSLTGKQTRGWLGAGIGETFDTPDVLKAHGVDWLADFYVDDLPCWLKTKHGPMVGMPYTVELNDVPIWAVEKHSSDEMYKRVMLTLDYMEKETADNPKVITIALHPHLIGVAHRMGYFEQLIDTMLKRNDTVFVTGSEIADWFVAADGTGGAAVA
jgi:peptidoglycan/xylan/chitin deacetylase (PgdA/CDA1 family)